MDNPAEVKIIIIIIIIIVIIIIIIIIIFTSYKLLADGQSCRGVVDRPTQLICISDICLLTCVNIQIEKTLQGNLLINAGTNNTHHKHIIGGKSVCLK